MLAGHCTTSCKWYFYVFSISSHFTGLDRKRKKKFVFHFAVAFEYEQVHFKHVS